MQGRRVEPSSAMPMWFVIARSKIEGETADPQEPTARHRQAVPLHSGFNHPIIIKIDRMLTTFDRREPPLK